MTDRVPLVLAAEDEEEVASLLEMILRREGFHMLHARSFGEVIDLAVAHRPDAILMDLGLPGGSGIEACDTLKHDPATADIPILIVTAEIAPQTVVKGLETADDFIRKPFDPSELVARVRAALRTKRRLDQLEERSAALAEMAFVDELTGLYNRRRMIERLEEEYKRARRYQYPISCLFIDLDEFKLINDAFGHQAGDEVLREVCNLLRGCIRAYDVACRYGGEELVVLLPQTDGQQALIAAERIRATIQGMTTALSERPITVSVGCASYPESSSGPDELLRAADQAMYAAKAAGRNLVRSAVTTQAAAPGPQAAGSPSRSAGTPLRPA